MKWNKFEMVTFSEVINVTIKDKLHEYQGCETFACDLVELFTEEMRINGTPFKREEDERNFVIAYWKEAAETYEKLIEYDNIFNPFDETGMLSCYMIFNGIRNRLSESKYLLNKGEDMIKLTPAVISRILKELNISPE